MLPGILGPHDFNFDGRVWGFEELNDISSVLIRKGQMEDSKLCLSYDETLSRIS